MDFSKIILAYFVIGAVMFGGGALSWQDSGVATVFVNVEEDGTVTGDDDIESNLNSIGGVVETAANLFAGPLLIVWKIINGLLTLIHWPLVVLSDHNAPQSVTVLLGGGFTAAFYLSVISLVVSSS